MEKQTVIELRGITKRFGANVIANNNVSVDVKKGEILSLLGAVRGTVFPHFECCDSLVVNSIKTLLTLASPPNLHLSTPKSEILREGH